jgi:hypothetical protein
MDLEEGKKRMAHAHTESIALLQEQITTQMVKALTNKVVQVKEKGKELVEKFHSLEKDVQG